MSHERLTRSKCSKPLFVFLGALGLFLWGAAVPRSGEAHSTTFAMYSKYEATANGQSIAFVFALDKVGVSQLLEREVVHAPLEPTAIANYGDFFSQYLFARFQVSNNGAPCHHPDKLARFFWDVRTSRVLAVTKFSCDADLSELTIRSRVTHDMPSAHELVGDLKFGRALERSFFAGETAEAHISLSALPQEEGAPTPEVRRRRAKFIYVSLPDKERRYDDLARAVLGVDFVSETATNTHPAKTLLHFIGQGVRHILTGYDHVLFIVTLLLVVGTWRRLALIVTSFTVAHSITLILATLGWVVIPGSVIEPLIAASVLFVAMDAVVRPQATARVWVTFAFGLLHGFGLSNVLRDLGLSGRDLVPALLGFNLGVELGQLAIVIPLFPLVLRLRRAESTYLRARGGLCTAVAVIAVFWVVLRVKGSFLG